MNDIGRPYLSPGRACHAPRSLRTSSRRDGAPHAIRERDRTVRRASRPRLGVPADLMAPLRILLAELRGRGRRPRSGSSTGSARPRLECSCRPFPAPITCILPSAPLWDIIEQRRIPAIRRHVAVLVRSRTLRSNATGELGCLAGEVERKNLLLPQIEARKCISDDARFWRRKPLCVAVPGECRALPPRQSRIGHRGRAPERRHSWPIGAPRGRRRSASLVPPAKQPATVAVSSIRAHRPSCSGKPAT